MQFRPGPPMHAMPAFSRPPFMNGSLVMPPGMPPQHLMRPPLMLPQPAGPVVLTPPGSNLSPAPAQKSTTLYVGKIASSVSDETIQTLLEACGPVKSWKPMQDPETNKSKGFGFCEYEDAEGVLRALRLLHNLALDGQELLLKCNTATQRYIDDYQASKKRQAEQAKQETADDSSDSKSGVKAEQEVTDDQQDDDILAKIMALVSDRAAQQASSNAVDQATDFLNDVLPPPPSRDRRSQQPSSSKDRSHTSRERERGSSAERNAERQFERDRQREKRELEIRQADLERAYQKKLRDWEQVERLREKSEDQKKSDLRDTDKARARAIRADNEQGDVDEDDEPWTRKTLHNSTSHAVESRRRKRKQELKLDAADQEAEDAERVAARQKREEEAEVRATEDAARLDTEASEDIDMVNGAQQEPDPNDPIYQAMMVAAQAPPRSASPYQHHPGPSAMDTTDTAALSKVASKHPVAANTKGGWHTVFGGDEDQDAPQRRLVPLNYSEEERKAAQAAAASTAAPAPAPVLNMDAEIDKLKKQIPRSMQSLATTPINWDAFEAAQPKMGIKVGKWVSGQIEKLLGQQEDTLLKFVQEELRKHSPPNTMLSELSPILDLEAEEFVLKLYQIVVFESSKFALSGQM